MRMYVLGLLLALLAAVTVSATEFRNGDTVTIPADQTIDDDLVATGNTVTILGHVTGDVVAAGGTVRVGGPVDGNAIIAGQNVALVGPIGGSVYAAGRDVTMNGKVARNLIAAGATLVLHPQAAVGRDATLAGSRVEVQSDIARNLRANANDLVLAQGAVIGGDLIAQASRSDIAPGAVIRGQRSITPPRQQHRAGPGVWPLWSALTLFVVGVLLLALAPKLTRETETTLRVRPGASALTGLIILLIGIPLFIVLLITIIGIPLAFLWLILYTVAIWLSPIFIALLIGQLIFRRPGANPYLALLLGALLLALARWIPILGGIIAFAAILFGLGAFSLALWSRRTHKPAEPPTPPPAPATTTDMPPEAPPQPA